MIWLELVTIAALLQYLLFGSLVSWARGKYGVKAPATSGHEMFDRLYRVQMNTLELVVVVVPALWLAAKYWSPIWVSGLGVVYLIGRFIYLRAYTTNPASRTLGFTLSFLPPVLLLLAALVGALLKNSAAI